MKFDDSFTVPVPPAVAWDALTDIERVYRCLPGAELTEVRDNEFHGLVTLKLGPITASYKGTARFESLDEENHTLVIDAQGRDRRGQGTASARVHAALVPEGDDRTRVELTNEVDISGKAAQFGRGILTDVSKALMGQFAENLREVVTEPAPAREPDVPGEASPDASPQPAAGAPLSVGDLAASVAGERAREDPVRTAAIAAVLLALLLWALRRALR